MTVTTKLYLLVAALFVFDALVTLYALHKYPAQLGEANGVLRKAMAYLGQDGAMLLAKALAFAWVWFWHPGDLFLTLIAVLYVIVVAWNVHLIVQRRS